jgi:diaminohydroxyphosphoribosylaminopyrimidine deaminase/5-amino-6-(5-phosphoribosylamino)uracil reductase
MLRALRLARRGQGRVEPNPMVGCVLVRGGRVLAEGYHRRFGGPHAEVVALGQARRRGRSCAGADLYVTLEPCCHQGKTPPCTDALIRAGVGRIFVAIKDPFSKVSGRGLALLRRAGIAVHVGLGAAAALDLNAPFLRRVTTGLPWVLAKWAQSLDGRLAAAGGDSRWISSPPARRYVHALRARVDAIVIGIGTALADDPHLTVRGVRLLRPRAPRRVVVDPDLRLPARSHLVRSCAAGGPALTLAVRQAVYRRRPRRLQVLEARGVEFVGLPDLPQRPGRMDLTPLLRHLAQAHDATNVLVEGGGRLFGALLDQGLIDQVLAFVAPKVIGDGKAPAAVSGLTCRRVAAARRLELRSVRRLGPDVLLDYRVVPGDRQRK